MIGRVKLSDGDIRVNANIVICKTCFSAGRTCPFAIASSGSQQAFLAAKYETRQDLVLALARRVQDY
jgi:hypothetical protein